MFLVYLVRRVMLAEKVCLADQVQMVKRVLAAFLEWLAMLELMAVRVTLALPAKMVYQDCQVRKVKVDSMVYLVLMDLKETMADQEDLAIKEIPETLVAQVYLADLDSQG